MTTYATMRSRPNATSAFWVEMSGIPFRPHDGVATDALLTDAYTTTLTGIAALAPIDQAFPRSIELHTGKGSVGGFTIKLVDVRTPTYPDGWATWLFGADRSSIGRVRLAEDIDIDEGTWTIASGGTLPVVPGCASCPPVEEPPCVQEAYGTAYIGLETIRYVNACVGGTYNSTTLLTSRSAYHSPSLWHRRNPVNLHYPWITDHPTVWAGRIVTLYQTYVEGDGGLAGTTATARAVAHKWRGVLRDVFFDGEFWQLRCDGIDTLLRRKICRKTTEATVGNRITVDDARVTDDDGTLVAVGGMVARIQLVDTDAAVGSQNFNYPIVVTAGHYSPETFVTAINNVLEDGILDTDGGDTFEGTASLSLANGELRISYTTASAAGDVRTFAFDMDADFTPTDDLDNRSRSTAEYWRAFGLADEDAEMHLLTPRENPPTSTTWERTLAVSTDTAVRFHVSPDARKILPLSSGLASSFAVGDAVAVVSDGGVTPCVVTKADATNNYLRVRRIAALSSVATLDHDGSQDSPIVVRRALYAPSNEALAGPATASSTLAVLLSTGLENFNHTDFDFLAEDHGVAFPHRSLEAGAAETESLIDVASFYTFFGEAEGYVDTIRDFIYEPVEAADWLTQRVGFLGGAVVVEDGRLKVKRLRALWSDSIADVTEDEILPGWRVATGEVAGVSAVSYKHGWSYARDEFLRTQEYTSGGDQASSNEQRRVEWEDKGIVVSPGNDYGTQLQELAVSSLTDYGVETWVLSGRTDRVHWELEPGQVVRFSDEGAGDTTSDPRRYHGLPNPDGTRGYTNVPMLVLSNTASPKDGTSDLRLANLRAKRSGLSPSAWIATFTNAGAAVLTCTQNVFAPEGEVDAARFAVGDRVSILAMNGTTAGAAPPNADESGFHITDISGNTITLNTTIHAGWVSGTTKMVLVHNLYQTASQTDNAKKYAHAGDTSGDVGDGGDDCFLW